MKQVTAILLGAGQRGAEAYASYALDYPNELKFVAVAEPRADRREEFAKLQCLIMHLILCADKCTVCHTFFLK